MLEEKKNNRTTGDLQTRYRRAMALAITAAGLGVMVAPARAASKTWNTAGTTANWNLAGNWTATGVPVTGDLLTFNAASSSGSTLNNDTTGLVTGNITFSATAAAYTINGNTLGLSAAASITNNSTTNAQTFNTPLTIAGLVTASTNILNFNASISDGATAGTFRAQGGTVNLYAANSFSGGITVNATTTLKLIGSATLGNTANTLTVTNGAILDLNGTSQTVGNLASSSNGFVQNNSGSGTSTLTIGTGDNGGGVYGGVLRDNSNATSGKLALVKNGTGTITLTGLNTYTGGTTINNGTLILGSTPTQMIRTSVVIGDGTNTAALTYDAAGGNDKIQDVATVTVKANGSLNLSGKTDVINTVTVDGGTIDIGAGGQLGQSAATSSLTMTAGTVANGTYLFSNTGASTITTNASASTAQISSSINFAGNAAPIAVANGSALIDLDISGSMTGNLSFTKSGTGTMRLSAAAGSNNGGVAAGVTTVNAGTLLVTNTSGSATGQRAVQINGGGTLGGTGIIGGVATYSNANVTLTGTGTSVSTVASVSPGDINSVSGADVSTISLSPLKIGGAGQTNSITFGNFSKLIAQLGNAGSNDQLAVTGNLFLNSAGNSDALDLQTITGATPSGSYTLATFTGTLTGRFDAVTLDGGSLPGSYQLLYKDSGGNVITNPLTNISSGSIVVAVPEPASLAVVGLAGMFMISRRRRVTPIQTTQN